MQPPRLLIKFEQDNQIPTLAKLAALDDPVAAISTLFDSLIAQSITAAEKKGNLIVNTALELPNHDDDVGEIVRSATGRLEAFFKRMIDVGQQRGDIAKGIPAHAHGGLAGVSAGRLECNGFAGHQEQCAHAHWPLSEVFTRALCLGSPAVLSG